MRHSDRKRGTEIQRKLQIREVKKKHIEEKRAKVSGREERGRITLRFRSRESFILRKMKHIGRDSWIIHTKLKIRSKERQINL